jgi:isopenicillin-N epimerase
VADDTKPATTLGRPMLREWLLDPDCVHLNHGTVGATPRRVLAVQRQLQDEIELNPARFMLRELSGPLVGDAGTPTKEPRLRAAAHDIAACFGAHGQDLVFTDNATTAINAVLRSFELRASDEILLFDHSYGAIRKTAEYLARGCGARVCVVDLPFPIVTPSAILSAVERGLNERTRIAIVDHITSPSALLLPVADIAQLCHARGVAVLVDGAHAPGAIPLDIPALGVDWYAGNLHKWAWAPRSSAILWVNRARQAGLHPTTISWGLDGGMSQEFDWVGTRDPTPYLAAPAALAFMRSLGIDAVQRYNHQLAWRAGGLLAERWGTALTVPEAMVGTMIAARLPGAAGSTPEQAARLRDALLFEDNIEVGLVALDGAVWARVSAQIYNELADIERLGDAVLARLSYPDHRVARQGQSRPC